MTGIVEIGEKEKAINSSDLTVYQALRDSEYTHPKLFEDEDPYVYHCGIDIFNNHRLRSNDFVYIDKINSGDTENKTFNTLWDVVRDRIGNTVVETMSYVNSGETDVHVYSVDTVMTMQEAFADRIEEDNGWFGFINKTDIDIPNAIIDDEEVSINKVMNNNKACEFIDMYPDRSLFSFIPKINKYRNRIEKNWDYCITYPYESDYDKFNEVVGLSSLSLAEGGNSLKISSYDIIKSPSGSLMIRMETMFKHTLQPNDYIKLFYKTGSQLNQINKMVKVMSIGDSEGVGTDKYFTIRYSDISLNFDIKENESGNTKELVYVGDGDFEGFYFKKNINNVDCQYYFRKFKKIKNEDDGELASDVNKLAYGENIYGDRLAQVVFTDDIDVDGLVDNNGRPLTEIYFTVIKRNAGNEIWYSNGDITNESVEFSHCFGKVTSGFDLPEEVDDYNVRKIHNISGVDDVTKEVLNLTDSPEALEYDITINQDEFYGDIVEFNPLDYTETVLAVVHHRFNTAQREAVNENYKNILYDRLQYDDYDNGIISAATKFTIISGFTNEYNGEKFYGNLNPEGYFYNPFTKIKIRQESDIVNTVVGKQINGTISSSSDITVTTDINYQIMKGDSLCFYNAETTETQWLTVKESSGVTVVFYKDDDVVIDSDKTIIIKTDEGVPVYAKYIEDYHTFVWRGILEYSELGSGDDLYDMPFANGAFYIQKNVNLFLKRQDPDGTFGLLPTNQNNPLLHYSIPGNEKVDIDSDRYFDMNNFGQICY